MFENPRRGRQARNFTTNVSKILDLKSSSEQIFFRKLSLGAPDSRVVIEINNLCLHIIYPAHLCHNSEDKLKKGSKTWHMWLSGKIGPPVRKIDRVLYKTWNRDDKKSYTDNSLSSVTRGWKLSFNLLDNNYFYLPITGRSHSCI